MLEPCPVMLDRDAGAARPARRFSLVDVVYTSLIRYIVTGQFRRRLGLNVAATSVTPHVSMVAVDGYW
jgi:hypothetical protein